METKICAKCGKSSDEVEFGMRADTYGKMYLWSRCKKCHADISRGRNRAARKKWGVGNGNSTAIRDNKPPVGTPCDCCGRPMTHSGKDAMQFDHDHKTEEFRGWLCKQCNVGIGQLGDDFAGLVRAMQYLITTTK